MIPALFIFAGAYLADRSIHGEGDRPKIPGLPGFLGGEGSGSQPKALPGPTTPQERETDAAPLTKAISDLLTTWGIPHRIGPEEGHPGVWWVSVPDEAIEITRTAIDQSLTQRDSTCAVEEGHDKSWYALITPTESHDEAPARSRGGWDHPAPREERQPARHTPPRLPAPLPEPEEGEALETWLQEDPDDRGAPPVPQGHDDYEQSEAEEVDVFDSFFSGDELEETPDLIAGELPEEEDEFSWMDAE